ncbi:MAG: hypothetical protein J5919_03305 [Clostridia bacterium]|nr:hypothetical protein [Clostridia bacterium]
MKVEVLFGEVCNQFGDPRNAEYLKLACPEAEFIFTPLDGTPRFVTERPDMILIGSMSERIQRAVIKKIGPFAQRIDELIASGTVFLATGNACEVFCRKIEYVTEKITVEGLGLFDYSVVTDWFARVNGKVIGDASGYTLTGFRSQFSTIMGDNSSEYFLRVERGFGLDKNSRFEGFRRVNFIGTQLLGPILPLNPDFCAYLVSLAGGGPVDREASFYAEAKEAYDRRVAEFRDPSTAF